MNNITISEKQYNYLEDVVYNGLNPVGIAIGGGAGDTSDLYYSKNQLDAGQLDNRYYRETEVNTWRNSVSQTEMGYLDGVTSDVQTQITARAIISGTPANDQLAIWTGTTSIEGSTSLTFNGTVLTTVGGNSTEWNTAYDHSQVAGGNSVHVSTTENTNWDTAYTHSQNNSQAHTDYLLNTTDELIGNLTIKANVNHLILKEADQGDKRWDVQVAGSDFSILEFGVADRFHIDHTTGNVGIGTNSPNYTLDVNGTGRFTGNLYANSHIWQPVNAYHYFGTANSYIFHNDTDWYFKSLKHGGCIILQGENTATGANKDLIIADPDGAVELYHAGSKKLETTAAGIDVTGITTTDGITIPSGDVGTDNYVSETTGWKGTYAGAFDFRSVYTDELIAKTFIADIDLALLSGHMVSKSVTQVSRDFTVPATSATGTLYCECLPGHPTAWCFETGDWLRLQIIDRSGGGLIWVLVWATVTTQLNINGAGDTNAGEQSYTITIQDDGGGSGEIVHGGAAAQDLGQSGDGYIQQEAGSHSLNTPYIQTATWVTDPSVGGNITVRNRLGNLAGITGQSGYGLVTRKDNTNYVSQWWNTESDWGIKGMVGGNTMFQLGDTNQIACLTIESSKLYIGTGTYGNANTGFYVDDTGQFSLKDKLTWNGTNLEIKGIITTELYDLQALKMDGANIWENNYDNDSGRIIINFWGYNGDTSRFRDLKIYNGKGSLMMNFDGSEDEVVVYSDLIMNGDLTCPTISGNVALTSNVALTGALDVTGSIRSTEVKYYSCPGTNFHSTSPSSANISYTGLGTVYTNVDGINFVASVELPNGAVISAVEVFGNGAAAAETWYLYRATLAASTRTTLATAAINTQDTSISNATVDNNTYSYFFYTTSLDTSDAIYGARITYTL